MELAFANKSLRELCESQLRAERKFGTAIARRLRSRLADLRDARSMSDVIAGRPEHVADTLETISLDLGDSVRLVVCANHLSNPRTGKGGVNWSAVSRVKIFDIGVPND